MRRMRKKIIIVNMAILLLIFSWLPSISGENLCSTSNTILDDKSKLGFYSGGIFNELLIKCRGSYLMEMFFVLLGDPVDLLETRITNFYNDSITLERHVTLVATREGRVLLDEFDDNLPFKLKSGNICITKYLDQYDWKYYDYQFGPFDFIWDIHIPEVDESITLVFHGYVFYFGTIIFNPKGDVI